METYNNLKEVDFRCGFSKSFLEDKLEDTHITQIEFHDNNEIAFRGHFGCGLFVNDKTNYWVNHRSFFFSNHGTIRFDFSEHKYKKKQLTYGDIKQKNSTKESISSKKFTIFYATKKTKRI